MYKANVLAYEPLNKDDLYIDYIKCIFKHNFFTYALSVC